MTQGPRWNLSWWADDHTAVGTQITGPNSGNRAEPGDAAALRAASFAAASVRTGAKAVALTSDNLAAVARGYLGTDDVIGSVFTPR